MATMSPTAATAASTSPTTTPAGITALYDTVYAYNAVAPFDTAKLPAAATMKPA